MSFKESYIASVDLIDRWLDYQTYIKEIPSVTVGIDVEGETIFKKSYGYKDLEDRTEARPEMLYRIASHSKLFTASAIMRLFAAAKLRLDDPVSEHLDWFNSPNDPNLEYVTLRHLLSHSSGMNRDGITDHWHNDEFPDIEAIKSQTRDGLSSFKTVEHWKYSNMAYTVLGQVIESVTGSSYETAVRDLVIDPMGLKNTMPDIEEDRLAEHATGYGRKLPGQDREKIDHVRAKVMNSATGFSTNVEDLIEFYRFHQFGNETFLEDRFKREMQRLQFSESTYRWGLGFEIGRLGGLHLVGHRGGYPGFITSSSLCQERKLIIVVFTSAINGPAFDLAAGINDMLNYAASNESKLLDEVDVDTQWLNDISGFYGNRWGVSLFQRLGSRMIDISPDLMTPSQGASLAEYEGDNSFRWVEGVQNGAFGELTSVEKVNGRWKLRQGESVSEPFSFEY